jgi:hypothetical protein
VSAEQAAFMARSQVLNLADNFRAVITAPAWRSKPSWALAAEPQTPGAESRECVFFSLAKSFPEPAHSSSSQQPPNHPTCSRFFSQTVYPGRDKSLETAHSTSESALKLLWEQSCASAVKLTVAIISMYFLIVVLHDV